MPLELSVQFDILIYSFLAGLLTGVLFDAYRIIRGFKTNKIIIVVEDTLFWFLAALIIFTFLLYTNYAFLGAYVYLFIFLSLALYLRVLSKHILRFEILLLRKAYKVIRIALKNFIYPFRIILKKLGNKN